MAMSVGSVPTPVGANADLVADTLTSDTQAEGAQAQGQANVVAQQNKAKASDKAVVSEADKKALGNAQAAVKDSLVKDTGVLSTANIPMPGDVELQAPADGNGQNTAAQIFTELTGLLPAEPPNEADAARPFDASTFLQAALAKMGTPLKDGTALTGALGKMLQSGELRGEDLHKLGVLGAFKKIVESDFKKLDNKGAALAQLTTADQTALAQKLTALAPKVAEIFKSFMSDTLTKSKGGTVKTDDIEIPSPAMVQMEKIAGEAVKLKGEHLKAHGKPKANADDAATQLIQGTPGAVTAKAIKSVAKAEAKPTNAKQTPATQASSETGAAQTTAPPPSNSETGAASTPTDPTALLASLGIGGGSRPPNAPPPPLTGDDDVPMIDISSMTDIDAMVTIVLGECSEVGNKLLEDQLKELQANNLKKQQYRDLETKMKAQKSSLDDQMTQEYGALEAAGSIAQSVTIDDYKGWRQAEWGTVSEDGSGAPQWSGASVMQPSPPDPADIPSYLVTGTGSAADPTAAGAGTTAAAGDMYGLPADVMSDLNAVWTAMDPSDPNKGADFNSWFAAQGFVSAQGQPNPNDIVEDNLRKAKTLLGGAAPTGSVSKTGDGSCLPEAQIETLAEKVAVEQILASASPPIAGFDAAKYATDKASLATQLKAAAKGGLSTADQTKLQTFMNGAAGTGDTPDSTLAGFVADFKSQMNSMGASINSMEGMLGTSTQVAQTVSGYGDDDTWNAQFSLNTATGQVEGTYNASDDDNTDATSYSVGTGSGSVGFASARVEGDDASATIDLTNGGNNPTGLQEGNPVQKILAAVLPVSYMSAHDLTGLGGSSATGIPVPYGDGTVPKDPTADPATPAITKKQITGWKSDIDKDIADIKNKSGDYYSWLGTHDYDGSKAAASAAQAQRDAANGVKAHIGVSEAAGAQTGTLAMFDAFISSIDDKLQSLGDMSEQQQMRIQMMMNMTSKFQETQSNMIKKLDETRETIVNNMK